MLSLHLGWTMTIGGDALAAAWRAASMLRPPACDALVARQWRFERDALHGQFLFDDDIAAVEAFVRDPGADAAFDRLAARVGHEASSLPTHIEAVPAGQRLQRPIFVIAAPRSGSTLLFDLLAQAPEAWTQGGEGGGAIDGVVTLHAAARGWEGDRLTETQATPTTIDALHAGWRFGLRPRAGRPFDGSLPVTARLLDKTTENCLRVPLLAAACPDARFVYLHRDARQNISSLMHGWAHGGFVRFAELPGWPAGTWCFLLPPEWRALRGLEPQVVATAQWEAANDCALRDLEMLDTKRWTAVDYNELVAHPRRVIERLCEFLELRVDDRMDATLSRPLPVSGTAISPPSTMKWRNHAGLDVAHLERRTRATSARLRHLHAQTGAATPAPAVAAAPWQPLPAAGRGSPRFVCWLADLPGEATAADDDAPLFVTPNFHFQLGASVPLGLATATRFRERFLPDQPIVWARDPLTGAWLPWWIARTQAPSLLRLQANSPLSRVAPGAAQAAQLHSQLSAAGIVASVGMHLAREQAAVAKRVALSRVFAASGYCVVRGMLPAAQTAALASYFRALVDSGRWALGDAQVARRHGWHNESLARFVHHQLTGFVGAIAGAAVCASYCYVSAYQRGAELDPHVDRKQCAYTISFIIDDEGGRSTDWPLWFLGASGRESVSLSVGDAVLFRGHELPHWREAAPQPELSLSTLLFHYVPTDFDETLN